jgi:hypothetical protein
MSNRRLPPRLNCILLSSGLLRVVCLFETDFSELPIDPSFKGETENDSLTLLFCLFSDCVLYNIIWFVLPNEDDFMDRNV